MRASTNDVQCSPKKEICEIIALARTRYEKYSISGKERRKRSRLETLSGGLYFNPPW